MTPNEAKKLDRHIKTTIEVLREFAPCESLYVACYRNRQLNIHYYKDLPEEALCLIEKRIDKILDIYLYPHLFFLSDGEYSCIVRTNHDLDPEILPRKYDADGFFVQNVLPKFGDEEEEGEDEEC